MRNTEELSDETARDLFGMVFDAGGVVVPPDDLAPAAMAGYRRYRRRRTTLVGAGASVVVAGVASVVLAVAGGGVGRSGITPGVWTSTETSTERTGPGTDTGAPTATGPASGSGTGTAPQASTPALGGAGGRLVDCFSNFEADGDPAKAESDCRRAEPLWQAVFPGNVVSGARNPSFAQITGGFVARVAAQKAAAPALYGRAQPQVVQDWTDARQADADAGSQSWSGFNIATAQGTIVVSADYRSGTNSATHLPCLGFSPCESMPLSDGSVAEVHDTGNVDGYVVTVRAKDGDAYRISFSSHYDPRYVDVPCTAPGGHCYADLKDGSIRPGAVPDSAAIIQKPVITGAVLTDILKRPAFAALVQGYFAGRLGRPGAPS